jgi:hypothetical protein
LLASVSPFENPCNEPTTPFVILINTINSTYQCSSISTKQRATDSAQPPALAHKTAGMGLPRLRWLTLAGHAALTSVESSTSRAAAYYRCLSPCAMWKRLCERGFRGQGRGTPAAVTGAVSDLGDDLGFGE